MEWACCPAYHVLLQAGLPIRPTFPTSHCAFLHLRCVMCTGGQSQTWECRYWAHKLRYTALSSSLYRGFPAPASQPQDSVPRQLSSDAARGDVGSACAAFAVAGNLTCKSRGEVCLGTTPGTAIPYDRQVFHKSKMLLFLNEIKLKKTPVGWKVIQ